MPTSRMFSVVLVTAMVAESAMLAILSTRHAELRRDVQRILREATVPRVGAFYPQFIAAASTQRTPLVVGAAPLGRSQLILVYSRSCQFCRASLSAWRGLLANTDSLGTVDPLVIALDSIDASRDSLRQGGINAAVVTFPSGRERTLARAHATPETVLLSADGRILAAHTGLVTDSIVALITRAAATRP